MVTRSNNRHGATHLRATPLRTVFFRIVSVTSSTGDPHPSKNPHWFRVKVKEVKVRVRVKSGGEFFWGNCMREQVHLKHEL